MMAAPWWSRFFWLRDKGLKGEKEFAATTYLNTWAW